MNKNITNKLHLRFDKCMYIFINSHKRLTRLKSGIYNKRQFKIRGLLIKQNRVIQLKLGPQRSACSRGVTTRTSYLWELTSSR